ncbi:SIR2 family protein [Sinomonas albida]|uniref:hypothetical protein n=1 Tax=Sinomonas albida TaxID=369942 RepID=UPI0010A7AD63|nr:hypothetical protein [Sinomonas albida]
MVFGGEPFLRDSDVSASLLSLVERDSLVIYCGAGVTRDRTNLGWNELVGAVFSEVKKRKGRDRTRDSVLEIALRDGAIDPKHKASIVTQDCQKSLEEENQLLAPMLRKALYATHGWQQGYLLRNVIRLSVLYAVQGRRISIVTSNYDDYIDRKLQQEIDDQFAGAAPDDPTPGLRVNVLGNPHYQEVLKEPTNGASYIDVHFIHGRVPKSGRTRGTIVFSENSYSLSRRQVVDFLIGQFNAGSTFLSVGASLNDEPLIEALIRTRPVDTTRVALVVPGATDSSTREAEALAQKVRGDHMRVSVLTPDSFAQVAQYVDELRVCAAARELGVLDQHEPVFCYSKRLEWWWQEWSHSNWSRRRDRHYRLLSESVAQIRQFFQVNGIVRPSGRDEEVLRLELWIRIDPSVSRDRRKFTLFANSTGPLLGPFEAMRSEQIRPGSSIAAIRTFMEGRPQLYDLHDLGYSSQASRWKSFLSVPIFQELGYEVDGAFFTGAVPVAVVTLTSTLPTKASDSKKSVSSFADPVLTNDHYVELLAHMIGVGREITSLK